MAGYVRFKSNDLSLMNLSMNFKLIIHLEKTIFLSLVSG